MIDNKFVLFTINGGIAALANIGSRFVFNIFVPYKLAIIFAYLVGMITAFTLFKIFVFEAKSSSRTTREIIFFTAINMLALLQTYFISIALADYLFPFYGWTFFSKDIAHFIGVMIPIFTSYIGHKHLTFKKNSHFK